MIVTIPPEKRRSLFRFRHLPSEFFSVSPEALSSGFPPSPDLSVGFIVDGIAVITAEIISVIVTS